MPTLPAVITSVDQLDELQSTPSPGTIDAVSRLEGDILLLGAAGKMGPSLARMALRASQAAGTPRRVIAVSRFSNRDSVQQFQQHGVETIPCDLLSPTEVDKLPPVANVISMVGMKFGSTGQEALTWAINCHVPALIAQKFRESRIVAFSTGNIYGLTPVALGGSRETDELNPQGDYAASCVGRERMFEHFSRTLKIPMAIIRLNYAVEMRYGVLVDIGRKVYDEQVVDVTMGHFNAIWQGDANAMTLCAFDHVATPPTLINVTGPEVFSVRRVAERFGELLRKRVQFSGEEASEALISNASQAHGWFGYPSVGADRMLVWIAEWIQRGGPSLGKPTHFEARDGKF